MAASTAMWSRYSALAPFSPMKQQIHFSQLASMRGNSAVGAFSHCHSRLSGRPISNSQAVVIHTCHHQNAASSFLPSASKTIFLECKAPLPSGTGSGSSGFSVFRNTRRRSHCCERKIRRVVAQAAAGAGAAPTTGTDDTPPLPEQIANFQKAFWKFTRPHTIRGTIMGSFMVVARTLLENAHAIDWGLTPRAFRGVLGLLCGNAYIVGINQVFDVDIDKVNKPFLPIAAGELSVPTAVTLCVLLAATGLAIVATNFGPVITALYSFGLFLGTIYSVPPLQLKRFPIPAFLIIATVRGFLLNFGVHSATRAALGLPFVWSPSIVFITTFVTVFSTVIALTKDLPDVEGDRKYNITTFATSLGVRNVAFLAVGLLLANYAGAVICALRMPQAFKPVTMIGGHVLLAVYLGYQTWLLEKGAHTKDAIAAFYLGIWNLFYSEYLLLPFI